MARYEVADGVAHKFWEISLTGKTFTVRWGRLGTRGQSQVKHFADDAEARRAYDKLVAEKRKKGYRLVDGIEESEVLAPRPASVAARSPELEAAVAADPDDESALLVLGDWLQTQGDPRGELISLQYALRQAASDPKLFLERKRDAELHYKQHEATLLGPLYPLRHLFRLEWQLGYIRGAKLSLHAARPGDPTLAELLRLVVDVPAAVALQELAFGHQPPTQRRASYQAEIDALAALGRPAGLRSLVFGDAWRGIDAPIPPNVGSLAGLGDTFRALRRLTVHHGATFGALACPELRYFEYAGPWDAGLRKWLARCPKLEHLLVVALPDPEPLSAERLPNLRKLRLSGAYQCVQALADATALRQLEAVELHGLTPEDVPDLVDRAAAFAHLKTFRVTLEVPLDDTNHDAAIRRLRAHTTATVTVNRYYPG